MIVFEGDNYTNVLPVSVAILEHGIQQLTIQDLSRHEILTENQLHS